MQFIVDNRGVKTSVIVPFDKWEKLNSDFKKLKIKLSIFQSIQDGFSEIKNSKRSGIELQSLSDFLIESIS